MASTPPHAPWAEPAGRLRFTTAVALALVASVAIGATRDGGEPSQRVVTAAPRIDGTERPTSTVMSTTPPPHTAPTPFDPPPTTAVATEDMTVPTVETAPVPPVIDPGAPQLVAREIPADTTPPFAFTSPWESVTNATSAGYTTVDVGCAAGTDAASLDRFFTERIGPLIGEDYQHVYPLGGRRYLWLFQDSFVDHTALATRLDHAAFVHNSAMVQDGACFTLYHRGTPARPASFEDGLGERRLSRWFWPMGGELTSDGLEVFWVEMVKDPYEPGPGDGLGWHPNATYLATYDPGTLARTGFRAAPNPGVSPVYGYAVSSDTEFTYLFGNTFEQNLVREAGFASGPHSATSMWLARVPRGQLSATPEYRTAEGWSPDAGLAVAISQRYWVENPMQPRFFDGVWVSVAKVDGYWGDHLTVDVAHDPWGPWTTVSTDWLSPRAGDELMNTYHAQLLPWRDGAGNLVVAISQNARNMTRDAFPAPARYRPQVRTVGWTTPPPRPPDTTVPDSTIPDTTVPETVDPGTTTADTVPGAAPTTQMPTEATAAAAPSSSSVVATSPTAATTTSPATSAPTAPTPSPTTSTPTTSTPTTSTAIGTGVPSLPDPP